MQIENKDGIKELFASLSDEQQEQAKACKSMDELTALLGSRGGELPDEALDAVAGGCDGENVCTRCGRGISDGGYGGLCIYCYYGLPDYS